MSKRGTKSQIDLTKKNLVAALKRLVKGAPIVHEKDDVGEGAHAPLPLDVMDSSHYHALLVQDVTDHDNNSWRDTVLLTERSLEVSFFMRSSRSERAPKRSYPQQATETAFCK